MFNSQSNQAITRYCHKAIAEHRRFPQDIEWAYRQGQFYILQTRPVTHLPAPTQPTDRRVVFDNSNIQESYCGVTMPLTFSFANNAYRTVYEQTMRYSMARTEKQIQDHRDMLANLLGLVHGRIYYNINNWVSWFYCCCQPLKPIKPTWGRA